MNKPKICATIVESDIELIKEVEPDVDLWEVRIDLVGSGWPNVVKLLRKPWLACNRSPEEGGRGDPNEVKRIEELLWAGESGASILDIEYRTKDLASLVPLIKTRAKCLVSYHDVAGTPTYEELVAIVDSQRKTGADICKVVTSARSFDDNLVILKLIRHFPETKMVAFAMGEAGRISRIFGPLVGGYLTYACLAPGKESAMGQMTVREMREIYGYIRE